MIVPLDTTRTGSILPRPPLWAVAFVTASMAVGCATARPDRPTSQPALPFTLTLLDTVVIPTVTQPPDGRREAWRGSLSGLARDPRSGRYLAVIDDREPSRVAWLDITHADGRLMVAPGEVLPVRPGPGVDARAVVAADLEAIVALPDGTWLASEEGHVLASQRGRAEAPAWPPLLLALDATLQVTRLHPWPDRFALGAARGGIRDNQGFESLTRTPDGRLIAGLEQPRHADLPAGLRNGRPFGGGRGGPSRLVELVEADGTWRPRREWVYRLDPTPTRAGFEAICDDGENGLTELLALDEGRLLALERACLQNTTSQAVRNLVRLYLVEVSDATDVAPARGVPPASARAATKTLLLDFDTLIPQWPAALANLDNFEGLAFGPPLSDGRRTLLVLSDDNFRATQNTVVVWFRIDETETAGLPRRTDLGAKAGYVTALYPTPRTVSSSRGFVGSSSR